MQGACLARQLLSDFCDVLALKAGDFEFRRGGDARTIRACNGRGAVGRTAAHFICLGELSAGVGNAHDDHAVMEEIHVEAGDGGLLPTVLSC